MIDAVSNSAKTVISITRSFFIPQEDLSGPIQAVRTICTPDETLWNRALVYVRHSFKQRTQFRVSFDILTRYRARTVYKRLRKLCVRINVGDPHQAELAIEAILSFAQSLDGKFLAPSAPDQSVGNLTQAYDSAMLREHSVNRVNELRDSPAIRERSADDSPASSSQEQSKHANGLASQQDAKNEENP